MRASCFSVSEAATAQVRGDQLDAPVVSGLPDGLYTLQGTLKNARLYTISCRNARKR